MDPAPGALGSLRLHRWKGPFAVPGTLLIHPEASEALELGFLSCPPPRRRRLKQTLMEVTASLSRTSARICSEIQNGINPRLLVFISRLILLVESLNTLSIIFSATGRLISLKNTGGSNRNLRADLDVTAGRSLCARDNGDGGARARLFLSDKLR